MSKRIPVSELIMIGIAIAGMAEADVRLALVDAISKCPSKAKKILDKYANEQAAKTTKKTYDATRTYDGFGGFATNGQVQWKLNDLERAELGGIWLSGNKISCIKRLRELTGLGLADAKFASEWMEKEGLFKF